MMRETSGLARTTAGANPRRRAGRTRGLLGRVHLALIAAFLPLTVSIVAAGYILLAEPIRLWSGPEILLTVQRPLAALLAGLIVSSVAAALLLRRVLAPAVRLGQRARAVSAGLPADHSYLAGLPSELNEVAEALDQLSEAGRARQRGLDELDQALGRTRELLRKLLANLREGVLIADAESGAIIDCNPAISRIFGYSTEEIVGQTPVILHIDAESEASLRSQLVESFAAHSSLHLSGFQMRRKDGCIVYAEITAVPLEDGAGRRFGTMTIIHDVTELRQYERRLAYLATHDQLTGLPSRRGLEDALAEAVAIASDGGSPSALLLIDLVRFKDVNDALGHQAGDEVLAAVARCVQMNLRGTDLAARLGSDEFAVLLRWTDYGAARLVAERLRRTVEHEFARLGAGRFDLKMSVGMAAVDGSLPVPQVMGQADVALSEAKRGGGDRIVMQLDDVEPFSRAGCP